MLGFVFRIQPISMLDLVFQAQFYTPSTKSSFMIIGPGFIIAKLAGTNWNKCLNVACKFQRGKGLIYLWKYFYQKYIYIGKGREFLFFINNILPVNEVLNTVDLFISMDLNFGDKLNLSWIFDFVVKM